MLAQYTDHIADNILDIDGVGKILRPLWQYLTDFAMF